MSVDLCPILAGHTCEWLQQHFGYGVTSIQPMFQDYQLCETWLWVLTTWMQRQMWWSAGLALNLLLPGLGLFMQGPCWR